MKQEFYSALIATALAACGGAQNSQNQHYSFKVDSPPSTVELECITQIFTSYDTFHAGTAGTYDGTIYGNGEEECTRALGNESGQYYEYINWLGGTLKANYDLARNFEDTWKEIDRQTPTFQLFKTKAERYREQAAWQWGEYSTILEPYQTTRTEFSHIDTPSDRHFKLETVWKQGTLDVERIRDAYQEVIETQRLIEQLELFHVKLARMTPQLKEEQMRANQNPIETGLRDTQEYNFREREIYGTRPSPQTNNATFDPHTTITWGIHAGNGEVQKVWAVHSDGPQVSTLVIYDPSLAAQPCIDHIISKTKGNETRESTVEECTAEGSIFAQTKNEPRFQANGEPCRNYQRVNPQADCGLTQEGWDYLDTLVEELNGRWRN
ncbi:hypothetical protein HYV86_02840 [Candidatus Woesearchaeota archaeon]|nr:hypothetical protein [Candidatus Woesearchaeota archaeon]